MILISKSDKSSRAAYKTQNIYLQICIWKLSNIIRSLIENRNFFLIVLLVYFTYNYINYINLYLWKKSDNNNQTQMILNFNEIILIQLIKSKPAMNVNFIFLIILLF